MLPTAGALFWILQNSRNKKKKRRINIKKVSMNSKREFLLVKLASRIVMQLFNDFLLLLNIALLVCADLYQGHWTREAGVHVDIGQVIIRICIFLRVEQRGPAHEPRESAQRI